MRSARRPSTAFLAPLRGVLAVLFLVVTSLQPGLFTTASAKGFDVASTHLEAKVAEADFGQHTGHGHKRHDHAAHGDMVDDGPQSHHGKRAVDGGCEVHCAPISAVPVDCSALQQPLVRCFEPWIPSALREGGYTEFIRPPRHLS